MASILDHGRAMRPIIDGVMRQLAGATAPSQSVLRQHPLSRDLAAGLLPRSTYVAWLGQLFFVHRALEWHLGRLRAVVPPLASVVRDHYFHTPAIASDLACFGVGLQRLSPLASTSVLVELIDGLAVRAPLALLGIAYVLEEGKNRGRQIAKRARLAYRLRPGDGVAYLDPYGEAQRQRWLDFKVDMEATGFEPAEVAVMADAAKLMFTSLTSILDEILAVERITRRAPAM
jgi:heme oxygenase